MMADFECSTDTGGRARSPGGGESGRLEEIRVMPVLYSDSDFYPDYPSCCDP